MKIYNLIRIYDWGNGNVEVYEVYSYNTREKAEKHFNSLVEEDEEIIFEYDEGNYIIYETDKMGATERIELIESDVI